MRIKQIKIEGVPPFSDLTIDLTDCEHMLLTGDNGSGKSRFLQAIVSCLTHNYSRYGGNKINVGHGKIELLLEYSSNTGDPSSDRKELRIEQSSILCGEEAIASAINNSNEFIAIYFDSYRCLPYPNHVIGPNPELGAFSSHDNSMMQTFPRGNSLNRLSIIHQWFINLNYSDLLRGEDKTRPNGYMSLFEAMMAIINQCFDSAYQFHHIAEDSMLYFKRADGQLETLYQMSDAFKMIFLIVGEILCTYAEAYVSKRWDMIGAIMNTEGVIIIDDIDLHLHPKMQLSFLSMIKRLFPKTQFIMSTHAPLILQSVRPNEIFQLTETNEEKEVERVGKNEFHCGVDHSLTDLERCHECPTNQKCDIFATMLDERRD